MSLPDGLVFELLKLDQLERAHEIEIEGYPQDEAASLEAFRYRQKVAPDLFLGATIPAGNGSTTLIGFVCATRSSADTLTHESMSKHEESGSSLNIHSVCVAKSHQRLGLATRMLQEYTERLTGDNSVRVMLLICHEQLVGLYEKAGFEYRGRSPVVHGKEVWYDMRKVLHANQQPAVQSGDVLAALAKPSIPRPTVSFHEIATNLQAAVSVNDQDLLCPRSGCGSVVLKKGVGKYYVNQGVQLDPESHPPPPPLEPLPEAIEWWLITPSPMEFENIAFSRPTDRKLTGGSGRPVKFLACAECELGPLGWCEEGSTQFWLAARRVAYRKEV